MAHNTTINAGSGGDAICDYDLGTGGAYPTTGKVPAGVVYVSADSTTPPTPVTAANGLYVRPGSAATWAITAAALPLPAGASTEATLAALAAKVPSLGQAVAAASVPVVLTASQLATLTPPGSVSVSNFPATQPVSGTVTVANPTTAVSLNAGANAIGSVSVSAIAAGTNTIGNVGQVATAAGGWTPSLVNSAASTNATNVKNSAGQVGVIALTNNAATWAYLKLYDKASAPTVGTDTPVHIVGLPPGSGQAQGIPAGLKFTLGIGYAITGGAANSDSTAVAANQVTGTIGTA